MKNLRDRNYDSYKFDKGRWRYMYKGSTEFVYDDIKIEKALAKQITLDDNYHARSECKCFDKTLCIYACINK